MELLEGEIEFFLVPHNKPGIPCCALKDESHHLNVLKPLFLMRFNRVNMSVYDKKPNWAWYVLVPAKAEFTQPQFHFGERVKWTLEIGASRHWLTGRIRGMWFSDSHQWEYLIALDAGSIDNTELEASAILNETELKLIEESNSIRKSLKPASEWQPTESAAVALGLSSDQLRNLRLKGLFKEGQHYRDASVPGSARPYWQWNVEQCSQLLSHR